MFIEDDGIRLNAKLEFPENASAKHPLVIVIHGFTGHMEERHITAVSKALNDCGCATLRVDMYGHGGSGGSFREHTLFKWMTNAMTVIDYARSLDTVGDIYLLGHSQGGLTVFLAGGLKHDAVSGVIALAPACMIPELARKGELLGTRFDPDRIPDELDVWGGLKLGSNYVRAAQMIHVEEAIDRIECPVLVVQGEADSPDLKQSAVDAAKRCKNAALVMIPGDTHCFDHHLDRMTDTVAAWMRERLQDR